MPSSTPPPQQGYSRESSYDSAISDASQLSFARRTIHRRRKNCRANGFEPTALPPSLEGFTEIFHSRVSTPFVSPVPSDKSDSSDEKRWLRMLMMQKEFHCYRSARLEAALEAMESGEHVPIPSKLCLDLLNEELKAQMEAARAPR